MLGAIDLSGVKGLETLHHHGPSTIGIDTIYLSKGKIPEVFLREAGMPQIMIDYLPSLIAGTFSTILMNDGDVPQFVIDRFASLDRKAPPQFYSCFISYSSNDEDFAKKLRADLQEERVRCWFAPEDMKIGDKILDTLDQAIRYRDKLLLVLSGNSIASDWVEDEVTIAFEEERRRGQTVLFPIRLDNTVLESKEAWAAKVRGRHIGDFINWKDHDAYKKAFYRLLKDLAATAEDEGINET